MAKGTYVTSDLYEATALIIYDCNLTDIYVDRSKESDEAIFKFDGTVEDLPAKYRDGNLLVDAKTFRKQNIELRRLMFDELDGRKPENAVSDKQ